MKHISTVIVGAGQAGLAMSKCLSDRSIAHVVIERGEVAQAWTTQRWDGLRLLTPNWQSRLPGHCYTGPDPHGFMSMPEVTQFLRDYARVSAAPVEERTTVTAVTVRGFGYLVSTDKGDWACDNVVFATGACAKAQVPGLAAAIPGEVRQLTALDYRSPSQAGSGGVLVVGASASGTQIAAEMLEAGHEVTLAVGGHLRAPRAYRGRDIQWWMDQSGVWAQAAREIEDLRRARKAPSLQLIGDASVPFLDLNALQTRGAQIVGRLVGVQDGKAQFSGALANQCALSDLKMRRLLRSFDAWAQGGGLTDLPAATEIAPTAVPATPDVSLDLSRGRIRTLIWATGYRPDFRWARLPIFDGAGGVRHKDGCIGPGLYVLGLPVLRRRNSALIDGVGGDAEALATHLFQNQKHKAA